ncbi:MAG: glycosyltransferase family 9 protein [Ignavibacteriae bacterium]|nr:glycosyltransferase family 9 protein [Ignavibacteriota bacterium]NOG96389.1 glycosyltransferase family 9 protein [Ignavibacteriota bacterium]
MSGQNIFSKLFSNTLKLFLSVDENKSRTIDPPQKVLVVRQHNQFGDLLASVSLFRAIKETYPETELTVIVSPENYYAISKNDFIDRYFVFDKKKVFNPEYYQEFRNLLKEGYDLAIVPATVSISFTSCLISRFAKSKTRIGPNSLNGKPNKAAFMFDRRVDLNWNKFPDCHVSDFILEVVRPFSIAAKVYTSNVKVEEADLDEAKKFIKTLSGIDDEKLIGFHIGAGKPYNKWSMTKFAETIEKLNEKYKCRFYITGSKSDHEEIKYAKENIPHIGGFYLDKSIPELAAVISLSDLFITNDTGVMHVAGATETPQISIFGPTNPFNWAPVGKNKFFLKKQENIESIQVDDVLYLAQKILEKE